MTITNNNRIYSKLNMHTSYEITNKNKLNCESNQKEHL